MLIVSLYSLIQILGSTSFLYFLIFSEVLFMVSLPVLIANNSNNSDIVEYLIVSIISNILCLSVFTFSDFFFFFHIGCFLKAGLFPYPWWSIKISSSLNWFGFFFLNVILKIPYIVLVLVIDCSISYFTTILSIFSFVYGVHQMWLNTNDVRIFLAWSSVVYLSFLFFINIYYFSYEVMFGFFFFYLFFILYFSLINNYINSNITLVLLIFSLSGMPPFCSFILKIFLVDVLYDFFGYNHLLVVFVLLMSTMIYLINTCYLWVDGYLHVSDTFSLFFISILFSIFIWLFF
uniref:NADH dehydrogenase subunit 2 n=1 Tax=Miroplana shenzhensis TaxID=2597322 RepID=UPI001FAF9BC9|nr:NADH dehydrogenase subunit 2 [Miroplana shenzhensis]UJT52298.1 NADH dehydrogenase subunit 2 [Miroplana shenzhensis]